mgnify:CR=1 FL=1
MTLIENLFKSIKHNPGRGFIGFLSLTYRALIKPRHSENEAERKELVCNVILLFVIFLLTFLNTLVIYALCKDGADYRGINPLMLLAITISFGCLLYISRIGYYKIASHILVGIFTASCIYGQIMWGFDLPSIILFWCFIITASSILISTRYAFALSVFIGIITIFLFILETKGIHVPTRAWKTESFQMDDALEYSIILMLIAGISWLSNREIYKSFNRVKISENLLRIERDTLEIKVKERTKEIEQAHIEKIHSMYRFVEFGRISGGLFHDLSSPLTSLCMSLNLIQKSDKTEVLNKDIVEIQSQLEHAVNVTNKINNFISEARKQIQHDIEQRPFSVPGEIEQVIKLLTSKSKRQRVSVVYRHSKNTIILGSPVLFSHIITNLISNAIDAYTPLSRESIQTQDESKRLVLIYTQCKNKILEIKVKDFGQGIPERILGQIFDPFFTTKKTLDKGCGIGLSATKHTLEKYFNGTITLKTKEGLGTTFTLHIPLHQQTLKNDNGTEIDYDLSKEDTDKAII